MPDLTADSPVCALWQDSDGNLTLGGPAGAYARGRLAARIPPVETVGDLCDLDAADILAIPRTGAGVLTEVRRAVTASGLALAGEPAPTPAAADRARRDGQPQPRRAPIPRARPAGTPIPATAEDFTALVKDLRAELAAADPETRRALLAVPRLATPAAYTGRPWAWHMAGPDSLADLTGYSIATLYAYAARSARQHAAGTATERTMPAPAGGKWATGDIALWIATRNDAQARDIGLDDDEAQAIRDAGLRVMGDIPILPDGWKNTMATRYGVSASLIKYIVHGQLPATGRRGIGAVRDARRAELIPKIRAIWEREGRITCRMVQDELGAGTYTTARNWIRAAGLEAERRGAEDADVAAFIADQVRRSRSYIPAPVLLSAAVGAGLPATMTQVRRLHPDVRAAEIRRRHQPAGAARARGESLHPKGWLTMSQAADDWGITLGALLKARRRGDIRTITEGSRKWVDPSRLRARRDRRRTPVDVTHPMAELEPGDPGYEEGNR